MGSTNKAKFGRVSSVFVDGENNEIFVNVITNPNQEPRKIKFSTPQTGFWMVPREGDIVEVHTVGNTRVARNPMKPPANFTIPSTLEEGDVCLQLNATTKLHFSIQPDGTVDVNLESDGDLNLTLTEGDLNATLEKGNLNLTLDKGSAFVEATEGNIDAETPMGNITASAPQGTAKVNAPTVKIGDENGTYKPVARQGDPVSVNDPDDGTISGQIDSGSSSVQSS